MFEVIVELRTGKRQMGNEDGNDMEDASGYDKSGVRLGQLCWEDLVLVVFHTRSGLVPAVSGMVT